ncbi:MAG: SHOCT domain-containing protein [Lachnospiraceae bacterium]|nr:SHOCT domain-containing protein [Lachnospiraceae bacterium]
MFWAILAAVGIAAVFAAIKDRKKQEEQKRIGDKFDDIAYQYDVAAKVTGVDNSYMLVVDDTAKQVIYMTSPEARQVIPYSAIMGVYVNEDETTVMKKSLAGTIGRSVVGNMIAGRTGAIIGGLTGSMYEEKKVSKIEVVIRLRDFSQTSLRIPCFDAYRDSGGLSKQVKTTDSFTKEKYQKACQDATRISELISVVIDQNANAQNDDIEDVEESISINVPNIDSIADELQKLADLKEKGLISDEEYTTLKAKLIN